MATDVTKNSSDIDNYEAEFHDLRAQLYDLSQTEFNGIRLFGDWQADGAGRTAVGDAEFPADSSSADNSLNVIISEDGTTNVNIHRALLGGALMVTQAGATSNGGEMQPDGADIAGLVRDSGFADTLSILDPNDPGGGTAFTAAAFTQALENIATLRATNGGQVQRLMYAQSNVDTQVTNLTAANGRIVDVDIAAESSNLAKQQVLVQAAASMTAQANVANDVALMLLR